MPGIFPIASLLDVAERVIPFQMMRKVEQRSDLKLVIREVPGRCIQGGGIPIDVHMKVGIAGADPPVIRHIPVREEFRAIGAGGRRRSQKVRQDQVGNSLLVLATYGAWAATDSKFR